jgi:K(+)-stimulated pyrophosphate-energized sodium pump
MMKWFVLALFAVLAMATEASARQQPDAAPVHAGGGEASLVLPDLGQVSMLGYNSRTLLVLGVGICMFGLLFGLVSYSRLQKLPVHRSMLEVSELIYETCKTYLKTQGRFILILEVFVGLIIALYFGLILHFPLSRVFIILLFSLVGIAGSYGVAWFGIRVNTFANSRTAFASLRGKPFPLMAIPLEAGMSIGMLLISVELFIMLCILLWIPRDLAGSCFLGFAIGESLGASALRIAGGIFTKIADIGADLMKIVFNIKEDDARNPGVIADCTGDNAGDSVGPSADGFETYGVTGVALITFILTAVADETVQVQLLVWIFMIRAMMVVASGLSYLLNNVMVRGKYLNATKMNFEAPLTSLVWIDVSVALIPIRTSSSSWHARCGGADVITARYGAIWGSEDFTSTESAAEEANSAEAAVAQHLAGLSRELQRLLAGPDDQPDGTAWVSGLGSLMLRRPSSRSAWSRSASWAWAR